MISTEWITWYPVIATGQVSLILSIGYLLIRSGWKKEVSFPAVSIIVTARNEEKDLPRCIESLEKLKYPKEKLQIVLVDDHSTDNTRKIISEAARRNEHFIAADTDLYDGKLEAKSRGIFCGIERSEGEWLLITDADAKVPEYWVHEMILPAKPKTGSVSGPVTVSEFSLRGILEQTSYTFGLPHAYGNCYLFKPFFALGPNMAIRKSAYLKAGGLENLKFKVAEDLALFRLSKLAGYKAEYRASHKSLVELTPVPSLGHVPSQLTRWVGGAVADGGSTRWMPILWLIYMFLTSFVVLFSFLWVSPESYAEIWVVKIISDSIPLIAFSIKSKAKNTIILAPVMWIVGTINFLVIPFLILASKKVTWKGDGYEISY